MSACILCGGDPSAKINAAWEFGLTTRAPSQNEISAKNHGGGRWAYKKLREQFMDELRAVAIIQSWPFPRKEAKRRVRFTRLYTGRERERDHGNMVGGLKVCVDAMVNVGMLVDDSPQWLEAHYFQLRTKDTSGLLIRLEELASAA